MVIFVRTWNLSWLEGLKEVTHLKDLKVEGRIISEWIWKEVGRKHVVYIHLAQERDQWEVRVSAIMFLWIPGEGGGSSVFSLTTEDSATHVWLTDINWSQTIWATRRPHNRVHKCKVFTQWFVLRFGLTGQTVASPQNCSFRRETPIQRTNCCGSLRGLPFPLSPHLLPSWV